MPVLLVRVDNRLVHGQVLETWVPKLGADTIIAVDEAVAMDPLQRRLVEALGRRGLEVVVASPEEASGLVSGALRDRRVLVLFPNLSQAVAARRAGVGFARLNLGNLHAREGSRRVSPSVYLTQDDAFRLSALIDEGVAVEARAVPADQSPDVASLLGRKARP